MDYALYDDGAKVKTGMKLVCLLPEEKVLVLEVVIATKV